MHKLLPESQPSQLDVVRMPPVEWDRLKCRLRGRLIQISNYLEHRDDYMQPRDDNDHKLIDELDQIDELIDFLAVLRYQNPD